VTRLYGTLVMLEVVGPEQADKVRVVTDATSLVGGILTDDGGQKKNNGEPSGWRMRPRC